MRCMFHPDNGTQWSMLDHMCFDKLKKLEFFLFIFRVDFPGFPFWRSVFERLKSVCPTAFLHEFALEGFVEERLNCPLSIKLHSEIR